MGLLGSEGRPQFCLADKQSLSPKPSAYGRLDVAHGITVTLFAFPSPKGEQRRLSLGLCDQHGSPAVPRGGQRRGVKQGGSASKPQHHAKEGARKKRRGRRHLGEQTTAVDQSFSGDNTRVPRTITVSSTPAAGSWLHRVLH